MIGTKEEKPGGRNNTSLLLIIAHIALSLVVGKTWVF
jgi:hypothetical protein